MITKQNQGTGDTSNLPVLRICSSLQQKIGFCHFHDQQEYEA